MRGHLLDPCLVSVTLTILVAAIFEVHITFRRNSTLAQPDSLEASYDRLILDLVDTSCQSTLTIGRVIAHLVGCLALLSERAGRI